MDPTAQQSSPQSSGQAQPSGAGPTATAQPVMPSPTQPVVQPISQPSSQQPPNKQVYSQSGGQSKMGKVFMLSFALIFAVALVVAIFFYLIRPNTYSVPDQNTTINQPTVQPPDQLDRRMDEFDGSVRTSETDINNATGGLNDQPDNL